MSDLKAMTKAERWCADKPCEAAAEIDRLQAKVDALEGDMRDIEILSDRLEAPHHVKVIHRIAKAALKGVDDE